VKPKVYHGIDEPYVDCVEVLNEILYSALGIHILELIAVKTVKCKARPNVFVNISSKLMEKNDKSILEKSALESAGRMRDLISSAGHSKHHYNSEKL
jgi:hypothetical protein